MPTNTCFGGVLEGQRDAGGTMYMRNRYYDPATGQFTQTDPIGIAGGLNSYGFANGDPVTYSDPYGLCPPCGPDEYWMDQAAEGLKRGGFRGAVQAAVGLGFSTLLEATGVNDFSRGADHFREGNYGAALGAFAIGAIGNVPGGRVGKAANLVDGMRMPVDDALEAAVDFLGKGYREVSPGRFLSGDGMRQVRMQPGDLAGDHGAGPHMNFETWLPDPQRPGRKIRDENIHVNLEGQ